MKYTVKQGKRYRATLKVPFVISNAYISGRLTQVGFTSVRCTGKGRTRIAEGTWPRPDQSADLPSQVSHVEEC